MGASTAPSSASTVPATSTRYSRPALWARNCLRQRAIGVGGAGHHQAAPRCPCPGGARCRAGPGLPRPPRPGLPRSGKRARSPSTSVPPWCPAPWWTTSPAGLSTTTSSASSWTTANTTEASGTRDVDLLGGATSTSRRCPPRTVRLRVRDGRAVEAHTAVVDQLGHRPAGHAAEQRHDAVDAGPGRARPGTTMSSGAGDRGGGVGRRPGGDGTSVTRPDRRATAAPRP